MRTAYVLETYDEVKNAMMTGKDISFEMVVDCKKTGELETTKQASDKATDIATDKALNIGDPYYKDGKLIGIYAGWCRGKHIVVAISDAPKQLNHDDAVKYCDRDTHLPTKEELLLIYINKDTINQALAEYGGEPLKEDDYYWSSTNYGSGGYYYVVDMSDGDVDSDGNYDAYYVRPVLAF